jgi:hypothetical protein
MSSPCIRFFARLDSSDDTERETKFKELELENERNKQVLTARITQLQNEIDLLVKEKKQAPATNSKHSFRRILITQH